MEFGRDDTVIVNPLRIRRHIINELESSTILFFSGVSRDSSKIITDQVDSIIKGGVALEAMHDIKRSAYKLKGELLRGNIHEMALGMRASWDAKKATSTSISNANILKLEKGILKAGATSMKVSGAGGGGFIMIFVEPELKLSVIKSLQNFDGNVVNFEFTSGGAISWTI